MKNGPVAQGDCPPRRVAAATIPSAFGNEPSSPLSRRLRRASTSPSAPQFLTALARHITSVVA